MTKDKRDLADSATSLSAKDGKNNQSWSVDSLNHNCHFILKATEDIFNCLQRAIIFASTSCPHLSFGTSSCFFKFK